MIKSVEQLKIELEVWYENISIVEETLKSMRKKKELIRKRIIELTKKQPKETYESIFQKQGLLNYTNALKVLEQRLNMSFEQSNYFFFGMFWRVMPIYKHPVGKGKPHSFFKKADLDKFLERFDSFDKEQLINLSSQFNVFAERLKVRGKKRFDLIRNWYIENNLLKDDEIIVKWEE